ncbi:MAG: hypothetical protein ACTH3E_11925 [Psychroflexus halocasei]
MAKQTGIIKLKGTIGGISFYKTSDGHLAREKGGVDGNRIKNDPAFQRTRENGSEFGRAGKAGKVLRDAIRLLLQNVTDKRLSNNLQRNLMKVIKTDALNDRGERTIQDGDMSLLQNFDFNTKAKFGRTLYADITDTLDRVTGEGTIDIQPFQPMTMVEAPGGTTHFKVVTGVAELDFVNENSVFDSDESSILPWDSSTTSAISMSASVTAASTLPLIQVVGVEFYQEVNGTMYPLKNGAFNALNIIAVDNS